MQKGLDLFQECGKEVFFLQAVNNIFAAVDWVISCHNDHGNIRALLVQLARKLHEKSPDVPVIIVTGYDPIDGGKDIVDCLQKEDLFPALLEKIKTLLHEEELVTARTA